MIPPASVGPPDAASGDPQRGCTPQLGSGATESAVSLLVASPWDGWPADWWTPAWGRVSSLTDTAWACIDLNASVLSTMPPYIVNGAPTLDTGWMTNPDPDIYSSWEEFSKSLFWDYQATGEVFVIATARYSTGWPARFHVVPPWLVEVDMDAGLRRYRIGRVEVTQDILHLRYQSSVDDAHGHGPLEAGRATLVGAVVLGRYANTVASGPIPPSVLYSPEEMSPEQAAKLRDDWVAERVANPGYPGVLTGGLRLETTQLSPKEMALIELAQYTDSKIAVLLGVPPPLVGLPTAGDSLTYNTVLMALEQHWRTGLRPKATAVMAGLSEWLLPRGTTVEVNKDAYVQPEPLVRAQTAEIYNRIVDPPPGKPVLERRRDPRGRTARRPNRHDRGGPGVGAVTVADPLTFVPQSLRLDLYAGDGAALKLIVTDPDETPLPLTGTVTAQIRNHRSNTETVAEFDVTVVGNEATLVLTGDQTAELGDFNGAWDCQWIPDTGEPKTLVQGQARCFLDVTRAG